MSCQRSEDAIHDFVDGGLPIDQRREMEEHLERCDRCGRRVEEIRELKARVAELPREIRPDRDLWPGIARRIRGAAEGGVPTGSPAAGAPAPAAEAPFWARPWVLAAAALLLVVVSSGITALLLPGGSTVVRLPGEARPASDEAAASRVRAAEAEYLRAVDGLIEELARRRDDLSPEALMVIEKNLEIIDEAIRRTRTALEIDPDNRQLARLLSSAYERKVELLRRVEGGVGL